MNAVTERRPPSEIAVFNQQLEDRLPQIAMALPAHIPPERFKRVVLTAAQNNPKLLTGVSRQSLFNSCLRAAQDGLLPDGREGAIVEFKGNAQWLPMVGGLRKKVRNSGEIEDWNAYVVYENDQFDYELGDNPFIRHKPALGDRGKPVAAYSVARFKDGGVSREVMSIAEIEKVRAMSRAKDGPWQHWYEEMCRKTVARRHSKVLPMSTDLDDLIRRDDELYNMAGEGEESRKEARRPKLNALLDQVAEQPKAAPDEPLDTATGTAEPEAVGDAAAADTGETIEAAASPAPSRNVEDPDFKRGQEDYAAGVKKCVIRAIRENERRFEAWKAGYAAAEYAAQAEGS